MAKGGPRLARRTRRAAPRGAQPSVVVCHGCAGGLRCLATWPGAGLLATSSYPATHGTARTAFVLRGVN
eukprot:4050300-Prymnesium_polylepis.1